MKMRSPAALAVVAMLAGALSPGYGYEFLVKRRPQSLDDPRLEDVRRLIETRYYHKAQQSLAKFTAGQKPGAPLVQVANRLELVSHYYPDWSGPRNGWESVVVSAIHEFLLGHDRKAVVRVSYALSLNRSDTMLDHFLADMEAAVGVKAMRLPQDNPRGFVDEMLARIEVANSRHDVQTVNLLLQDLLDFGDQSAVAVEKAGSLCYVMERYQQAADLWTKALALETTSAELDNIRRHISLARRQLDGHAAAAPAPTPAPAPAPARHVFAFAPARRVFAPAPATPALALAPATPALALTPATAALAAAPPAPVKVKLDRSAEVERLYEKGIELYARGEYRQATDMFMRILQIDPDNAQALKALESLKSPQTAAPSLTPEHIWELHEWGIAHYTRGEIDAAKQDFELILRADPDNEEAKQALRRINVSQGVR
jgi:tetratricopeptide (TPR) repeat protein